MKKIDFVWKLTVKKIISDASRTYVGLIAVHVWNRRTGVSRKKIHNLAIKIWPNVCATRNAIHGAVQTLAWLKAAYWIWIKSFSPQKQIIHFSRFFFCVCVFLKKINILLFRLCSFFYFFIFTTYFSIEFPFCNLKKKCNKNPIKKKNIVVSFYIDIFCFSVFLAFVYVCGKVSLLACFREKTYSCM